MTVIYPIILSHFVLTVKSGSVFAPSIKLTLDKSLPLCYYCIMVVHARAIFLFYKNGTEDYGMTKTKYASTQGAGVDPSFFNGKIYPLIVAIITLVGFYFRIDYLTNVVLIALTLFALSRTNTIRPLFPYLFCVFYQMPRGTVAKEGPQAPLFMGFSRQEYWKWVPYLPPGDLFDPHLLHWQVDSLPL